ncbi:MAG TPA: HD domain-containing phosphohydrolase [Actinomycetota bacterium]
MTDQLRLADLLVAISVATDLGMGQEPEKAARSCLLATRMARGLGLPEAEVREVYLATLLRHLGCTATAHEEAHLFGGDELASRPPSEAADFGEAREMLKLTLATGRGAGLRRPRLLARALLAGRKESEGILRAICEVGSHLASRLGLGHAVERALYQVTERWDGTGTPEGAAGEEIVLPARIAEVATQAVIFDRADGPEAALAMVERRSGGWFDPGIVDAFRRMGPELLAEGAEEDPWEAVLAAEPEPLAMVGAAGLDRVARAFADMVDLKSPYTLGHSTGVAKLAVEAGRSLGLNEDDLSELRLSALMHDVGRTGISNGIWDKPGPLTTAEREMVRMHPYHTERILARSTALAPLVPIAGAHHERQDGSGYHHGASGAEIPVAARILAAADAYQAMTQERPHRPARPPEEAAEVIAAEASAGRLDPDREVEVLRLVARGLSNKEIAERLFISPRTAEHHVQHIYAKIGSSTRASAAVFAMEHDLLGP